MALIEEKEIKSINDLKERIRAINKNVILVLGSTTCPPCTSLSESLNKWDNEDDIPVITLKVPYFEDMKELSNMYKFKYFPTVVLVNGDLDLISKMDKYMGFESFEEFVVNNMRHFNK